MRHLKQRAASRQFLEKREVIYRGSNNRTLRYLQFSYAGSCLGALTLVQPVGLMPCWLSIRRN